MVRQKSGGIASSVELAISHDMVGLVIVCSYFLRKTINYSKILVTKRLTGRLQTSQCDPYNDISRTVCVPRAVCKTIIPKPQSYVGTRLSPQEHDTASLPAEIAHNTARYSATWRI